MNAVMEILVGQMKFVEIQKATFHVPVHRASDEILVVNFVKVSISFSGHV